MESPPTSNFTLIPEGVLARLRAVQNALPEAEQRVASFLLRSPADAVRLPVNALAERIGVSGASIVRCCQSLGYRGLRDLRLALAAETVTPLQVVHEEVARDDSVPTIVRKVLQYDMQTIADTLAVLDSTALEQTVHAVLEAPRIAFYGVGSSIPVVLDAHYRFMRIGLPVLVATDPYVQLVSAAQLPPRSVAFAVSHTGRAPETGDALRAARAAGATTVLLSSHTNTPLAQYADIELITATREVVLRTESIASRIAHLCVLDALYVAVSLRQFDHAVESLAQVRSIITAYKPVGMAH